ncbi:acyl carrier protein [Nocardia tenerifensis]|uniref:Acyl carrier protein n=1 Tax=Nocardia tenerifensis TaxID=228006 RepID=A0A318KBR1_9NOCA|nr:acyl carrier protein [Nocardia tenerifensis]PXX71556.1 acyl carrier protein [Nocardia tenerifensis]
MTHTEAFVTERQVRATLVEAIEELGIEAEAIEDSARLHDDLGLDSTETVQVSLAVGRAFGRKITLEKLLDRTVADVTALVLAQLQDAESPADETT